MKNKKLSLKDLRVKSFVTHVNNKQVDKFKAGVFEGTGDDHCCSDLSDCDSNSPSCAKRTTEAPL